MLPGLVHYDLKKSDVGIDLQAGITQSGQTARTPVRFPAATWERQMARLAVWMVRYKITLLTVHCPGHTGLGTDRVCRSC